MLQQLAKNVFNNFSVSRKPIFDTFQGGDNKAAGRHPSKRSKMLKLVLVAFLAGAGIGGCVIESEGSGEHASEREAPSDSLGGERGEEESGELLTLDETFDTVRGGARLIIGYHAEDNIFAGTVQNTTNDTLAQVRVEVHLSNGIELGPTTPVDLVPGQLIEVTLPAPSQAFDGWVPHAEVGVSELGSEGSEDEGTGEHGSEREAPSDSLGGERGEEESGELLTLDETFDTVRGGARLIIGYHAEDNIFAGTVQNTTNDSLAQVRVEVHLSNGIELGPTTPVDLVPGQLIEVTLAATSQTFDGWVPHAEVGAGEHGSEGSEGEGTGEHG